MFYNHFTRREVCKILAGGTLGLFSTRELYARKLPIIEKNNIQSNDKIKAFCIDFNWAPEGKFAPPGMFTTANAKDHFRWYQDLGVNTIQTFCVSCCGYAWYQSSVPPVNPGMKGDFLKEITEFGHAAGMKVMGYFCIGANSYWGQTHPELSQGVPGNKWHILFTAEYLDYLSRSIEDVLQKVPIDGFMVDWLWNVKPTWLECEQKMYTELFDESFPGKTAIDESKTTEFMRRSVERAWMKIYKTTKSVNEKCIIWLSCYNLKDPQVAGSKIFKEVDWLMNEHPDPASLEIVRKEIGPHTQIIQCLCGWGEQHDANKIINDPRYADVGFYGFAMPNPDTTFPPTDSKDKRFAGNAKNIEIMRKAFRGK